MSKEMRIRGIVLSVLLVVLAAFAVGACGGGDDNDDETTPAATDGTPSDSTPAPGTSTNDGGGAGGGTVTLTISDGTAAVGQTADVDLQAVAVGAPGLGAYTVDISFDADIVSASSCQSGEGLAFCNADFDPGVARAVGAIAEGSEGDVRLGTITFTCNAAGTSDLTISVETLADATIGDPTDINHTEEHGTITCS